MYRCILQKASELSLVVLLEESDVFVLELDSLLGVVVGNNAKLARATDRQLGVARVIKRYKPLVQGRGRE